MVSCRERVGRASSHQGVSAPIRLPSRLVVSSFARPSASPLLSFLWSRFLVVFPVGWLCAALSVTPVFFDSLCASYAQRCILCARAGAVCVRVSRRGIVMWGVLWCVGVPRAWVWGSSGVLLGCERGRVSVSLVFFFEEATMPEPGGASRAHPGPPRVIE